MALNNSNFNVMDMAKEIAKNDEELGDLFVKKQMPATTESKPIEPIRRTSSDKKKPWTPDAELLKDMPELTAGPVTYDKSEIKEEVNDGLKNISDDNALESSIETMNDLERKSANIEEAKRRNNIKHLHIPEGVYQVHMLAAAGDTNYQRAQHDIDEILKEIKDVYPEWIEYYENNNSDTSNNVNEENNIPNNIKENTVALEEPVKMESKNVDIVHESVNDEDDVKIVIDKSSVSQISWSEDEIDKIRKARKVQLDIIETKDIEYSQIVDIDDNAVDAVLAPYIRRANDIVGALPASKYRCTFTGLSYPEVIDLSNSQEMNNIDGERKKWSIAYNHIKNPSIGPWKEYKYYIDPITKKKIKMDMFDTIPSHINPDTVTVVSKFEDFLMKTSFMDLDFILWKILCATTMNEEIISIDCHAYNEKTGSQCGNSYDWVYRPADLLVPDSIDPVVFADMEKASIATTLEQIEEIYNSSMLNVNNTATLTTSGLKVVFGHISAYDYLSDVYGAIESIKEDTDDASIASRSLNYTTMTVVKAFLVPQENGKYIRIRGVNNLMKVIEQLDEIDWQTLTELVRIMLVPYQFKYALRDIVCPKCKNRSMIPIESMERLLFIVARSLSSVSVELKKI